MGSARRSERAARQRRRHVPVAPRTFAAGAAHPLLVGRRFQRRRPTRPRRRQLAPRTSRCCWATATARSSRQQSRWRWPGFTLLPGGRRLQRRRPARPGHAKAKQHLVLLGNGDGTFQAPHLRGGITPTAMRSRATSTATAARPGRSRQLGRRRLGAAGQRRRHVPDPGPDTGGTADPVAIGGGRLQRRRPPRPGLQRTRAERSRCYWATATAPSSPRARIAVGRPDRDRGRAISTATAGSTWSSHTMRRRHGRTSCWATATAPSRPQRKIRAVGIVPDGIVAGDFNGDGRLDLAVATIYADETAVVVLLGNGDGTFQPRSTYAVGIGLRPIVAGDFNGDGRSTWPSPMCPETSRCSWATATVRSSRRSRSSSETHDPWRPATSTATAARPGRRDYTTTVSVFLGNGDGTFQPRSPSPVGSDPIGWWRGISTATASSTWPSPGRRLDAACRCCGATAMARFRPAVTFARRQSRQRSWRGDFNGDGRLDLAATDRRRATFGAPEQGDGTFTDAGQIAATTMPHPSWPTSTATAPTTCWWSTRPANPLPPGHPRAARHASSPRDDQPRFPSRDIAWVPAPTRARCSPASTPDDDAVSLYAWREAASSASARSPPAAPGADHRRRPGRRRQERPGRPQRRRRHPFGLLRRRPELRRPGLARRRSCPADAPIGRASPMSRPSTPGDGRSTSWSPTS